MGFLRMEKSAGSRLLVALQAVFIMCWLSVLADTDARHSVYSLCGILAVFCLFDNYQQDRLWPQKHGILCLLVSGMFSGIVALANYPVFAQVRDPVYVSASTNLMQNVLNLVCCLIGGTCVACNIVTVLLARLPLEIPGEKAPRKHPGRLFLFAFLTIAAIDLIYLFLDEYPGHVTPDSLDQIIQGYEGSYTNNHPFWHTYAIKVILSLGYALSGSANGAVAFFSICQLLVMAACFAYGLVTLYQAGIPKWCIGLAYGVYALMPHNIALSITMWKDVPFSLSCMVLVISLYRILASLDRKKWVSYLVLILSGLCLCMSRTTGVPTLILTLLFTFSLLWKRHRAVLYILLAVLVLGWVLTGPALTALGVGETDFTEALSIPLQQVARVVYDGCPLTEEETELLSRIFDLEEIPELYTDWLADPIKLEVRENDMAYFRENLGEYGKLWLRLGLKYPGEYVKAWVDQTKGYWNGGYDYHQYAEMVEENTFSIAKTSGNNIIAKLIYLYFGLTRHSMFFEPLLSIGLHVWLLVLCWFVNRRKNREEAILSVPPLAIILGLLIGTPVYAEFRYAYAVFLTCPVVLPLTLYGRKTSDNL